MKTRAVGLAATVLAALLIIAGSVAPAAARHGSSGGGGHSMGGGGGGARSFSGHSGARVYGFAQRGGHARQVYGYASTCDYEYRRAVATGSEYWWDRYYACTGEGY